MANTRSLKQLLAVALLGGMPMHAIADTIETAETTYRDCVVEGLDDDGNIVAVGSRGQNISVSYSSVIAIDLETLPGLGDAMRQVADNAGVALGSLRQLEGQAQEDWQQLLIAHQIQNCEIIARRYADAIDSFVRLDSMDAPAAMLSSLSDDSIDWSALDESVVVAVYASIDQARGNISRNAGLVLDTIESQLPARQDPKGSGNGDQEQPPVVDSNRVTDMPATVHQEYTDNQSVYENAYLALREGAIDDNTEAMLLELLDADNEDGTLPLPPRLYLMGRFYQERALRNDNNVDDLNSAMIYFTRVVIHYDRANPSQRDTIFHCCMLEAGNILMLQERYDLAETLLSQVANLSDEREGRAYAGRYTQIMQRFQQKQQ